MMMKAVLVCGMAGVLSASSVAVQAAPDQLFPGQHSHYRGYERYDFSVDGCPATVVVPRQPAADKPWVWRAEFFDAFPQVDLALLAKGFHLVYINVGNTFGCPDALKHWDVLYKELTEKHGLSRKPVLEGLSRGGLYAFNWAADHPGQVGCILADNAVLDFKSWPAGRGKGKGSPGDWKKLLHDYHFESEAAALAYPKNPVDNLGPLAKAKVSLFLLCGDADEVVPYEENGAIVQERYRALGGPVRILIKKGMGHHPHGLADPRPVVEFIMGDKSADRSPVANTALVPVPKLEDDCYDWYARHSEVLRIKDRVNPEIVMIGDSITHFWAGPPECYIQRGPKAWEALFGKRQVLNLGFGWDRTQNVLWRLDHGEFDGLHPRYVVVNIGTNNFSTTARAKANSPSEIAEAIQAILVRIRSKSPNSRIILMGVFPRGPKADGPFRAKIAELNKLLPQVCKAPGIVFVDIGSRFLRPDGDLPRELMSDFCHPTEQGYSLWAAALKPLIGR